MSALLLKKDFCLRGASVDSQSAPWEGLRWDISWLDINRQKSEENLQTNLRVMNPGGYFKLNWSCFLAIPKLFQAFWFRLALPCRAEQRANRGGKIVNFAREIQFNHLNNPWVSKINIWFDCFFFTLNSCSTELWFWENCFYISAGAISHVFSKSAGWRLTGK